MTESVRDYFESPEHITVALAVVMWLGVSPGDSRALAWMVTPLAVRFYGQRVVDAYQRWAELTELVDNSDDAWELLSAVDRQSLEDDPHDGVWVSPNEHLRDAARIAISTIPGADPTRFPTVVPIPMHYLVPMHYLEPVIA